MVEVNGVVVSFDVFKEKFLCDLEGCNGACCIEGDAGAPITPDEVSHAVEHPAVYEDVTTYHSVCNECGELIDGHAAQHIAETGHSGYSRNVPLTETVLKTPAWSETVVDSEAWVENVADHMVCTECGATQELSKDMASQ